MQHYVGLCPMFDVEVMNADAELVLGDQGAQSSPSNVARGLSSIYKEITETVRKEAATIAAVFPSPNDVMSILVQRVLEDRVPKLLEKLLLKPSLVSPPPMEEGGLILYLRLLAVAYEKTQELARDLRGVGCGDLDVEGLTESLFLPHKDIYIEYEQASLRQLYKAKCKHTLVTLCRWRSCAPKASNPLSSGTIGRSKGASMASSHQQISVTVVTEFVRWNEEAVSRCTLFSSQSAANVRAVFTCLLDQVSIYITEGLERARDSLTEAAALRERFVLGTSVSRRVAAAAASAAEAAAAAGESSFRSFMVAVQRCGSSVAIVQQWEKQLVCLLLKYKVHNQRYGCQRSCWTIVGKSYDYWNLSGKGLTESLFLPHKDIYIEYEQASLRQLYKAKMEELRTEGQQSSESSGTIGRSKGASMASSHQQISVTVVTEFVRWNEEAVSRCTLFSSQVYVTHVSRCCTSYNLLFLGMQIPSRWRGTAS
ncbi:exocyst complex component sec10 [Nicotiana attenuata]|uniref:Exocyst complex component sec10 n=1 Tax=Nicotiana attenuata TaxID=49451 RepID=A0A1J6L103_NICAT|nr:exocyst complex component sec10 [Nicotiana attenuata]